jgi:hypothetical protein
MPVWPFLWVLAGLAMVLALLSRDRRWIATAAALCGALVAARLARVGLDAETAKLALAAAWVTGATFAGKQGKTTTARLMALSGLCYFWGRLSGAPIEFGQPPYVLADIFAGAAILITGRGAASVVIADRGRAMGGGHFRRRVNHSTARIAVAKEQAGQ